MPKRRDVTCNRCYRLRPYNAMIHSRHTKQHYCADEKECMRERTKHNVHKYKDVLRQLGQS